MKQGFLIALLGFGEVVLFLLIVASDVSQQPRPTVAFTDLNATFLATLVATGFAGLTWRVYAQIRDHAKEIERAYISISHSQPGLRMHEDRWLITVQIKNAGHTPADILGGKLWWSSANQLGYQWVEEHRFSRIPPAYVGPGDPLFLIDVPVPLTAEAVHAMEGTLWIGGEIDYRDRFKDSHRGGYGRRYRAGLANNLVFDESTTGLNYDRPLTRQERDRNYDKWDQPKDQP